MHDRPHAACSHRNHLHARLVKLCAEVARVAIFFVKGKENHVRFDLIDWGIDGESSNFRNLYGESLRACVIFAQSVDGMV